MHDQQPSLKRIYQDYLAFIYLFTYRTTRRQFLGFSMGGWIKFLALLMPVLAWLFNAPLLILTVILLLFLWVRFSYWHARRAGYVKFTEDRSSSFPPPDLQPLPPNERVRLRSTGVFVVREEEAYLLLRPSEYWQVPKGDHVVMVQASKEQFMYQFFNVEDLQEVRAGALFFGTRLLHTLAITFLETRQVIEPIQFNFANPNEENVAKQKRTIYFTFGDEDTRRAVWHNIVHDARRVRS